jgi:hypothetical protein
MSIKEIASAAVMLLASSAGVYFLKFRRKPDEDFLQVQILTPDSYKEITTQIRTLFNQKYWVELKLCRELRRRCLSTSQEYQSIVLNFQKVIKKILEDSTFEVLNHFRVNKKTFEESVNFYDNDLELKEFGDSIIKPLPIEFTRIKLTADQTKQILMSFNEKLKEKNQEYTEVDEYLVATSQIEDEIFKEHRIEMEEFNAAVEKYKKVVNDIVEDMKITTSAIMASSDNSF